MTTILITVVIALSALVSLFVLSALMVSAACEYQRDRGGVPQVARTRFQPVVLGTAQLAGQDWSHAH